MMEDRLADRSLRPRLVERLYWGAMQFQDRTRRLRTAFIIVCGLLTLRAATIQHVREPWIDWNLGAIVVPELDLCNCRRCHIEAHNRWLRSGFNQLAEDGFWADHTDVQTFQDCKKKEHEQIKENTTLTTDDLLEQVYQQYSGKTERAARTIPFGHSRRATAVFARFFDEYEYLDLTQEWMRKDLRDAARNAPGLNAEAIIPHGLRASGITILSELFPHPPFVKDIAGHADLRETYKYIRQLPRVRTYQAYEAVGREEDAPPVVPENPAATFPVLFDPARFEGELWDPCTEGSEVARRERANDRTDQRFSVVHPRDRNLPDRAGFPDDFDEKYSITDHADNLPDWVTPDDTELVLPRQTDATITQWQNPHELNPGSVPEEGFRVDRQTEVTSRRWRFKQKVRENDFSSE